MIASGRASAISSAFSAAQELPVAPRLAERSRLARSVAETGQAYLRDLHDAELHLLDGGHWALETNLDEVVALVRDFLDREHSGR
jgi:pimeloyl-ACP methyl ester carboxylesterase